MTKFELPKNWSESNLDELCCYIQRGKSPKYANEPNDFPVVNQKAIRWHGIEAEHLKYVHQSQWSKWEDVRFIIEGDILWNSTGTGTIGRACYVSKTEVRKAKVVDSHVTIVRPVVCLDSKYIFYWIMHPEVQGKVDGLYTGTTNQVELSRKMVQELEVPLAPLAEQKVIADKLDTLLAQVETIKARLERIPKALRRFRQSVLNSAMDGRLTEEWKNRKGFSEWDNKVLGDVVSSIDQGWSPKCHNEPTGDESWGVIKTSSVLPMGFVEHENKKLPNNLDARPNLRVLASDILTTRAGPRSRCGITCYVSSISKNLMICDKVYRYRVIEGEGSSKFLALQLNSPSVLEEIETLKTGISESGMNLTQKKFRQLEISWPSSEEQIEIVRRVDELLDYADRTEKQVSLALDRVNDLTQSILAKAFRGELTEQWRKDNPDLISGENSAEALLQRIKAEREQLSAQKPKRQKRSKQ